MAKKRIGVLCEMLLQFDLRTDLSGGGERWCWDFIGLLKNNGYEVDVYQFSYEQKDAVYHGIKIHGIGNICRPNYNECMTAGLKYFHEKTEKCDGIFLLSMNLSQFNAKTPTLIVSHGLFFDNSDIPNLGFNMADMMKTWVRNSTKCVSVDTNSIHAMQLLYPKVASKMTFVPNYVDLNTFKPNEKSKDGRFKVLFPRRIDPARGYIEMAEACQILSKKYDDIDFIFCGRGHEHEEKRLHEMIDGMDNVTHLSYESHEMYKAYEGIHVSCIPTVKSEGTSLSCLESMATGSVPIATTIGGLTDLVRTNCEGLIISPKNTEELTNAIEYLYLNRDVLEEMRENCIRTSKYFSKEIWDKKMLEIIKEVYGKS